MIVRIYVSLPPKYILRSNDYYFCLFFHSLRFSFCRHLSNKIFFIKFYRKAIRHLSYISTLAPATDNEITTGKFQAF